jgi:sigma-54 dependent transcriptional regulator, flagellar regulatory protein
MGNTMSIVTPFKEARERSRHTIIGSSSGIELLRRMISRVADSEAAVMIAGASGSGKELVARAIHDGSSRAAKPFVAINCGAIPAELIESELFGHEKGSFTGAQSRRIGRFEEADGGTLFLDEIGDMRFDMQVKLLRVLEEGVITRVGGNAAIPVNVRILSATHQDIDLAIRENRFREDLYFRLGVVPVSVPDLASRIEDLPALIAYFQQGYPLQRRSRFDASAMARLGAHRWPGNVRELRNVVERAGVLSGGQTLNAHDVDALLSRQPNRQTDGAALRASIEPPHHSAPPAAPAAADKWSPAPMPVRGDRMPVNLKELLETMELERIQMALDMADGVISEAARLLTLKRTTLIEKMRKYGVDRSC